MDSDPGKYNKVIVYYFTGTGNSRSVSSWISEIATGYGLQPESYNIAFIDRLSVATPPPGSLIVFVSPIHGFNYPPVMLNFIFRFPKGKNDILLMNTRAGMLIGKFITPGLTGIAFLLSSLVMRLKGYRTRGMIPVDLPSNWISLHPGLNDRTVKYLHEKNRERVFRQAGRVIAGGRNFRALREIVQDILVSPIALAYYLIGRFALSKTYYAARECNNCGLCIRNCPVKAIKMTDNRPYWTFRCESCMRCMSNCPKKAIETAHGFIAVVSILFSAVVMRLIHMYAGLPVLESSVVVRNIFEPAVFLLLLAAAYRLMHHCLRSGIFERIMVYTSLTRYRWWGRRYRSPGEQSANTEKNSDSL